MTLYQSIEIFENFFHITYICNKGAAFGLLAEKAEWFRLPFFIGASLAAIIIISIFYTQLEEKDRLLQIGFSLIVGGTIGNLIDRIRFGEVVDFIDVHWFQHHWPAFNIADSAISIGVFLLIIELIISLRKEKKHASNSL